MLEWRPIPGYEGLYEVSAEGDVRSLPRLIPCASGESRRFAGRGLTPDPNKWGYLRVTLHRSGRQKRCGVHELVALAFIGPKPVGAWVLHRDDDKRKNIPGNLYYGTRAENAKDAIANGRQVRGSRVSNSKLTEADIPSILAMRSRGETYKGIGIAFGVATSTIFQICVGKWWKEAALAIHPDQLSRAGGIGFPRKMRLDKTTSSGLTLIVRA
jgi:hypothetical protein